MAKREIQEVNAGSMADIAFLLLIFFLMTTTMDTDQGLFRTLPPIVPEDQPQPPPIHERNVFEVLINAQNQLLVERQPMELRNLKDAAKIFLENAQNLPTLPIKEIVEVPIIGPYLVAKLAVISLQTDRGTQYQTYLSVQNELQAAITELRNELSRQYFYKDYKDLDPEQQAAVRTIYPQRISEAEPRSVGGRQ